MSILGQLFRRAPESAPVPIEQSAPSHFAHAFEERGAYVFKEAISSDWIDDYRGRVVAFYEKLKELLDEAGDTPPPYLQSFRNRGVMSLSIAALERDGPDKFMLLELLFRLKDAGVLEEVESFYGEKCYFLLDSCSIRMHRPEADLKMSRLHFHQEAAAFSYPASDFRGCVIWLPLEEILDGMPSFQFVNHRFDDVLPHVSNSFSNMIEIEGQDNFEEKFADDIFDARDLKLGDVTVISPLTPHRTVTPSNFTRRRVSLDLRVATESGYPSGYAGSSFRP